MIFACMYLNSIAPKCCWKRIYWSSNHLSVGGCMQAEIYSVTAFVGLLRRVRRSVWDRFGKKELGTVEIH